MALVDLDDRRVRWLLWAALAMVGIGIWVFVLRGADEPADPTFEDPGTTSLPVDASDSPVISEPTPSTVSEDAPEITPPGDPTRIPFGDFDEVAIVVEPGDGRGLLSWCLLAALTREQRAQGMIGVSDLQGYDGMAFLYAEDVQNEYHMRGVPKPLSIAWISSDGEIVSTTDMEPCEATRDDCPLYPASGPYRYSIEVFQGGLDDLGIVEGSKVSLAGSCAART
jgi:uncharacterized membrane protein (UPF0127 family)